MYRTYQIVKCVKVFCVNYTPLKVQICFLIKGRSEIKIHRGVLSSVRLMFGQTCFGKFDMNVAQQRTCSTLVNCKSYNMNGSCGCELNRKLSQE